MLECGVRSIQRYESGRSDPPLAILWGMSKHYGVEFSGLFPEDVGFTSNGQKK